MKTLIKVMPCKMPYCCLLLLLHFCITDQTTDENQTATGTYSNLSLKFYDEKPNVNPVKCMLKSGYSRANFADDLTWVCVTTLLQIFVFFHNY